MRPSLPGSCTGQISISGAISFTQGRYAELPPPAYGKQKRRTRLRACGLGLSFTQALETIVSLTGIYSFSKASTFSSDRSVTIKNSSAVIEIISRWPSSCSNASARLAIVGCSKMCLRGRSTGKISCRRAKAELLAANVLRSQRNYRRCRRVRYGAHQTRHTPAPPQEECEAIRTLLRYHDDPASELVMRAG